MIQLSKGGNINLAKEANGVTEFSIGLGWDIATQAGVEFDLDVATIPLNAQDKAVDPMMASFSTIIQIGKMLLSIQAIIVQVLVLEMMRQL